MRFNTAWVVEGQETETQKREGLSSPGQPQPSVFVPGHPTLFSPRSPPMAPVVKEVA